MFFRRGPFMLGLSCLLPRPGDYMTHDYSGVPMLLARDEGGALRGFLNVCRHRGARVAEGCGNGRRFSCPYHAWTYGLDGRLVARPDEPSFAGMAKASSGLREVPVHESYGMIWASPTPGAGFDMDAVLGGLHEDLAAYRLESYHHYETRVIRRRINWRIAIDTFQESYHLQVLHRSTVDPILHSNVGCFDAFGRSLRTVYARRTISTLRDMPEAQWDVIPYWRRSTCCSPTRCSSCRATTSRPGTCFRPATAPTRA